MYITEQKDDDKELNTLKLQNDSLCNSYSGLINAEPMTVETKRCFNEENNQINKKSPLNPP